MFFVQSRFYELSESRIIADDAEDAEIRCFLCVRGIAFVPSTVSLRAFFFCQNRGLSRMTRMKADF